MATGGVPSTPNTPSSGTSNAAIVEQHYNSIEEKGLTHREQSRIVYLRNFNNWIKSMLIDEYLTLVKSTKESGDPIRVFDLCCGKGGDIIKWTKSGVSHVAFADIAEQSVTDASNRYNSNKTQSGPKIFSAEFIVADCSRTNLRSKLKDQAMMFDLVSCQFALHYTFESLATAETMLKNVSDLLKIGGYFIGTIPNAYDIVGRKQKAKSNWFGNRVFTITFEDDLPEPYPLFGGRYNFHLHEVVDCPEYLVYFPLLERLAARFGLRLIKSKRFQNYYDDMRRQGGDLLNLMSGLETYSPCIKHLLGPRTDYAHAKGYFEEFPGNKLIGTLSQSEWEVSSLYMTFAFKKVSAGKITISK